MLSLYSQGMKQFTPAQTHGILLRPEQAIIANSEAFGWRSMFASTQHENAYQDSFSALDAHLLIVHLDGPVEVRRELGGRTAQRVIHAGGLFLMPAQRAFTVSLGGRLTTVHLYVRGAALREIAEEIYSRPPEGLDLLVRFGERDELLESMGRTMKTCLGTASAADRMMAEALATSMAVHLLRSHSTASDAPTAPAPAGLSGARLSRVRDYVEAHLDTPITVADLAAVAGLSPIHFARAFRAALNMPPHRYVMDARIQRARRLLDRGQQSIAEIAFATGFSHQEHLTRVFKQHMGVTPGAYRRDRIN